MILQSDSDTPLVTESSVFQSLPRNLLNKRMCWRHQRCGHLFSCCGLSPTLEYKEIRHASIAAPKLSLREQRTRSKTFYNASSAAPWMWKGLKTRVPSLAQSLWPTNLQLSVNQGEVCMYCGHVKNECLQNTGHKWQRDGGWFHRDGRQWAAVSSTDPLLIKQ